MINFYRQRKLLHLGRCWNWLPLWWNSRNWNFEATQKSLTLMYVIGQMSKGTLWPMLIIFFFSINQSHQSNHCMFICVAKMALVYSRCFLLEVKLSSTTFNSPLHFDNNLTETLISLLQNGKKAMHLLNKGKELSTSRLFHHVVRASF